MHPLLKKANKLTLSKANIERFAKELPDDDAAFDALITEAIEDRRENIFSTLALVSIPSEIASRAILLSGDLGSGRKGVYQGIKRLKLKRDVFRARIGVYRVFFTISNNEIQFLDVFHRRELERKIKVL